MIQMSKERLEELKGVLKSWEAWNDWNESQRIVLKDLTYYLERVQDLEGDAENIYRANHDYSRRNDILTQQNKRYREALECIVRIGFDPVSTGDISHSYSLEANIARKTLNND